MCGIWGGHASALADSVPNILYHRGPDASHEIALAADFPDFRMGASRLSIVSAIPVEIPFSRDGAVISYNGEIYNWKDIRHELEGYGWEFRTQNDMEVALVAYLQWGPECLNRFNGMFAIAILHRDKLFLARDRVGKKPVFLYQDSKSFAFASEIKAFAKIEADENAKSIFDFWIDENTPYKNVKSLPKGHYALFDLKERKLKLNRWWNFPEFKDPFQSLEGATDAFVQIFEDACRIRNIAEAPISLFLSGGIDSSLIAAVTKPTRAFLLHFSEFDGTIDERPYVQHMCSEMGIDLEIVVPTKEDFLSSMDTVCVHAEMAFGSMSLFPLYWLNRAASRRGYRVMISGEGADELFSGYVRNELLLREELLVSSYRDGSYAQLARKYFGADHHRIARMASRSAEGVPAKLANLAQSIYDAAAPLGYNISKFEMLTQIEPLLNMSDRMSMANSIEMRNPFLDYRLVELSARLPDDMRFDPTSGSAKPVLREALRRKGGTAVTSILARKEKHGLPSPVNEWLFGERNIYARDAWNSYVQEKCFKILCSQNDARVRDAAAE